MSGRGAPWSRVRLTGLLETRGRTGVWPDSVQVPGGTLLIGLPTPVLGVWLTIGLQPAGCRDEAWLKRHRMWLRGQDSGRDAVSGWLKKGLPCS